MMNEAKADNAVHHRIDERVGRVGRHPRLGLIPFLQQARNLLAPCGSFAEGFDTLDLKEAKGLLLVECRQSPIFTPTSAIVHCAGFRTPALMSESRGDADGVRKAPRHEIAVGSA